MIILGKGIMTIRVYLPGAEPVLGVNDRSVQIGYSTSGASTITKAITRDKAPTEPDFPTVVMGISGANTVVWDFGYPGWDNNGTQMNAIDQSLSSSVPWAVVGSNPAPLPETYSVKVLANAAKADSAGNPTSTQYSSWRIAVKNWLPTFANVPLAPASVGNAVVYVAGIGGLQFDVTALMADGVFQDAYLAARKKVGEKFKKLASKLPGLEFGMPNPSGTPVSQQIEDMPTFFDFQVGVLNVLEAEGTVSTTKLVKAEEIPFKVVYLPSGEADNATDFGSSVAEQNAISAANAYDQKMNQWMVYAAKPAVPSTWPDAAAMAMRPAETTGLPDSNPLAKVMEDWWTDRNAKRAALMEVTTVPASVRDAAFARDVAQGYTGTRGDWDALASAAKPFTATPAQLNSTGNGEGSFWDGVIKVIGGLGTNTADVLKSWGGGGTAAVVGTASVTSSGSFEKYLPYLLIGGIAFLLLK